MSVAGRRARVAVALCCLLASSALAGCGAEQQAASSADYLARQIGQGSESQTATTSSPSSAGRPTTEAPVQPGAKASLLKRGKPGPRKVVAVALQMTAVPGQPGGVDQDILDTLSVDQVRSTVFMAALWAQANQQAAAKIGKDPLLEVGNGGYSSEYLKKLNPAVIKERTARAQQAIHAVTGVKPKLYRDAQTGYTPQAIAAIAAAGVRPVSGDIDLTHPKPNLSAQAIARQALAKVHNGSIIVLRGDTKDSRIVRALVFILGGLKRAGYEDVTVSQLIGLGTP